MIEFALIIWIGSGVTAAYIAHQKKRNSWGWLALGLLFGVFALIAICAVPAQPRRQLRWNIHNCHRSQSWLLQTSRCS
jgi:membrane protein YdbS with pleckstrin-like domain